MKLAELLLNRFLYRDSVQTAETLGSTNLSADQIVPDAPAVASGNATYDINSNSQYLNGAQLNPNIPIPPSILNISNYGWTQTCAFTSVDADTVTWGAGTFTSADGIHSYSIGAGTTGNMAATTYIYLDTNVSTTGYQQSTNITDPIGIGKVLIAVCKPGTPKATYNLVQTSQIVGDNILANSISGNKITAGSITTTQISSTYVYAGYISADQINTGTLTGIIIQTDISGQRVVLTNTLAQYYNSSDVNIAETYASSNSFLIRGKQSTSAIWLDAGNSSAVAIGSGGTIAVYIDNKTYKGIYPRTGATSSSGYYCGNQVNNWYQVWTRQLYVDDQISLNGNTITDWSDIASDPTQSQIENILTDMGASPSTTLRVRRVDSGGVDSGWYYLHFTYGVLDQATIN